MVPQGRIELPTSPLPRVRSATELLRQIGEFPLLVNPARGKHVLDGFKAIAYLNAMAGQQEPGSRKETAASGKRLERSERLKAALKANIRRRKTQMAQQQNADRMDSKRDKG